MQKCADSINRASQIDTCLKKQKGHKFLIMFHLVFGLEICINNITNF